MVLIIPIKMKQRYSPKPKGLLVAEPEEELVLGAEDVVTLLPVVFVC